MKSHRLVLLACLLLFCSCKKDALVTVPRQAQQVNALQTAGKTATVGPLLDTLAPANAVSVKKYSAAGDGTHDDTNALQAAINSETVLVLPAGTYIINNTLSMRSGIKIYGAGGAVIKAGNSLKGTLLSRGMYFNIENADNSLITNIKFQKSTQPFKLGDWSNTCILIFNSRNNTVSYNNFDFNLPYAVSGLAAVWVSGSLSSNNIIKSNKMQSVGIEYAENGANTTLADGNYISHAPGDGLSAHGNSDTYCSKNVVINNVVENSGLMGIEDWGKVDGTLISNNTITGVGKDPSQGNSIGISAVGINSRVVHNIISDAIGYYIESGGDNTIDSNVINDSQFKAIGIIGNFTADNAIKQSLYTINKMKITGNIITGCTSSIVIYGNYNPYADITGNTMTNPAVIGINVDTSSPTYVMNIADNKISFTVPNQQIRKGFESHNSFSHSDGQHINLNNNSISYAGTATGGPGLEYGFEIGTDNVVVNGNYFYCNNIKGAKLPVVAITGNTDPAYNLTVTNNLVYGGTVNFNDFTIKARSGNNFD
ncbi:right-handed parallel beta-helix repeat-containing protein [Mucilaginibacter sp. UR6-11]|uniref:right-handed parallel beta-helix repeat-containing protein n=1 Tax=Mucilaginibacter sp. UR6-11 TaxID=1435644 RepID=UPI001E46CD08|nr:right-handed parallel beta-helix repeat-containing protein [Mucilaginibacter sp. UR6-11]MCC8426190.1 right-handed parallel beta-helix repeat-containing protein [Mucilaginibacter sp. UR6-11]